MPCASGFWSASWKVNNPEGLLMNFPLNPTIGQANGNLVWDGEKWVCASSRIITPWELWEGPYPLEVGPTAPNQVKVWYSTLTNQLLVWNWHTASWVPTSATISIGTSGVVIGATITAPGS